jgi:regulator of protease activity HflC (stomatin/prohibitin superfamily)
MSESKVVSRERQVRVQSGAVMLAVVAAVPIATIATVVATDSEALAVLMLPSVGVALFITLWGFFSLQPNEARVLVLFGSYKGTVRESGFHWGNPFYTNRSHVGGTSTLHERMEQSTKQKEKGSHAHRGLSRNKLSLRARTLNGERLKVNDSRGNPIEIAAVVVWRVEDTAQAMFDVDDFEHYVTTQSESALRHLASQYAYDQGEEQEITLRSNVDEVSHALRTELDERLKKAGVTVDEARLTHLAYAPEIAQAMLRRQQAEAVIAARQKIVQGAVSMVQMALTELAQRDVVHLDDDKRAAMVSNLMVVLCGESEVHPIVNAGTLYS